VEERKHTSPHKSNHVSTSLLRVTGRICVVSFKVSVVGDDRADASSASTQVAELHSHVRSEVRSSTFRPGSPLNEDLGRG
jgi:hypothetical protein